MSGAHVENGQEKTSPTGFQLDTRGKRRRGRLEEMLRRTIAKESANINVSTHDLQELAKDCWCWRDMISALCAASGSGGI
jgi:hypothetical protein